MLTTLTKAKQLLGLPDNDPSMDMRLSLWIGAASAAIEKYCCRTFGYQDFVNQKYDGTKGLYLLTNCYPIIDVSSVMMNGIPITDYEIVAREGMLYRRHGWDAELLGVSLNYTAGYVLPDDANTERQQTLPEPLELACILYCQTLMRSPGVSAERVGDISVTYTKEEDGLPFPVKSLIDPYRRWG